MDRDGYALTDVSTERFHEFADMAAWAFGEEMSEKNLAAYEGKVPMDTARGMHIVDPSRGEVGTLAGIYAAFSMDTVVPSLPSKTVPRVPTAGLTWVAVHPGHRRRGLLTTMMADHFSTSLARGAAISTLWAAETAIYPRFGYGLAAQNYSLTLPRGATLRPMPGSDDLTVRIERLERERHASLVERVLEADSRPGSLQPPAGAGMDSWFLDVESDRDGAEAWRIVIVERDGEPRAFAKFRRTMKWKGNLPAGTVGVLGAITLDATAAHRLWSVLVDMDLTTSVKAQPVATDDPLLWLLKDVRTVSPHMHDNIWLRLLDLPAALQGRGYSADAELVLEITDAMVDSNTGRWTFTSQGGGGSVAQTQRSADISLDISDLSAIYLGGAQGSLAASPTVTEHTPGALSTLARAFTSDRAPMTWWNF